MTEHFELMVPGTVGAGKLKVHAPYDNSLIATVDAADADVVEKALQNAADLFADRDAWLPPAERIAILRRAAVLMAERADELATEAAREGGKPLKDSRVEVARAVDGLQICIETLRTKAGREIPMGVNPASLGRMAMTRHEPIGPVVAVSAFNHPLNLIVHQAGPAIAAGCPVIVKPAGATPLSCLRFVSILREAGLPDAFCQALAVREQADAERLATDPRTAFLSFIGSARVGWMLRSKLAPGTRCALEHGGVAPVIVAADADLDDALPLLVKGGFYHAGQVCVSVQRVFAHRSIAGRVAEQLAELAEAMVIGDPVLEETDIGPLIRPSELDRIAEWVTEAREAGARIITGGRKVSDTCYEATVLFDPPDHCRVSREEVFGPVVCVYPYDDLDDAIRRANALPYAFQASVFTADIDTALRAAQRLAAAAVMINDHTAFRVDWMPFAGLRKSGLGVGGIPYTMHDMQVEKLVVWRSREL